MRSLLKQITFFCKKFRYVLLFIAVAAFVLPEVSVYFHKASRGADIHGYLAAGKDALALNDLYVNSAPGKNNTWPPFFSFFIAPLAVCKNSAGLPITKILWYFINFAALIATIQIISQLLYDKRPSFLKKSAFDFTSDKVFVPVLCVLPSLVSNFFMLQINALILFLVCAGLLYNKKEKPLAAGIFLALAASIKAYPGLFVFYFLFRKQWKTALATIVFGILFTLSPVVFYGIDGYIHLMQDWLTLSFAKPFVVGYTTFNNHSLYAFWERLLAHQLHCTEPASSMIKLFNLSSICIILISSFAIILRFPYRDKPILQMIEFSIICTMMILFPPIAWGHYWLILLPAAASIYYCVRMIPRSITPLTGTLSVSSLLLMQVPYFFSKTAVKTFLKMYSSNTFCALLVLVVLLLLYVNPEVRKCEKPR